MQFDMSRAWREATEMLSANREVVLAVTGVFFFLPGFASALMMNVPEPPMGGDPAAMEAYLIALYKSNAPIFIGSWLVQLVGMLTLLALLRDDSKPTVGTALKIGALGLLPYLGAYGLFLIALFLVVLVLGAVSGALGTPAVAIVLAVLAVPALIYVAIKLSLMSPVIAIEKLMNPVAIIRRSWRLTKGNSLRLLLFYFLLTLVYLVIGIVAGGIIGVAAALLGEGSAYEIANGISSGLIGAAATMVFTVVLAAIHRQLAGPSPTGLSQTFG